MGVGCGKQECRVAVAILVKDMGDCVTPFVIHLREVDDECSIRARGQRGVDCRDDICGVSVASGAMTVAATCGNRQRRSVFHHANVEVRHWGLAV